MGQQRRDDPVRHGVGTQVVDSFTPLLLDLHDVVEQVACVAERSEGGIGAEFDDRHEITVRYSVSASM